MKPMKSTASRPAKKVKKPYPGFPLFPHATGRWAKKIRGRFVYFGKTSDDPQGEKALERFNLAWPYLKDGRTPPPVDVGDGCTLQLLANAFLTAKRHKVDAGELGRRSFEDYYGVCDLLIERTGESNYDIVPTVFAGGLTLGPSLLDGSVAVPSSNDLQAIVAEHLAANLGEGAA